MSAWIDRTRWLREEVEGLDPGSFALVMATGIVSIAAFMQGYAVLAWVLLAINLPAYLALWMATLARLVLAPSRLFGDLRTYQKGPAFFTLPASSCVLGNQLITLAGFRDVATVLWVIGASAWLIFIYAFFFTATISEEKPSVQRGVNGTWLVAIVATQSVSQLGTILAGDISTPQTLLFGTLSLFLLGCALYVFVIALILYRFLFFPLRVEDLTPPYWITMGAEAITTLSSTTLIQHASQWSLLADILPFLKGTTLLFWAIGTWWIPFLILLGVWRYLVRRFPLRYDVGYWAMVFPLGMYAVCTHELSQIIPVSLLGVIPRLALAAAILAWAATATGLLVRINRLCWRGRPRA